jgi:hypothetical protein
MVSSRSSDAESLAPRFGEEGELVARLDERLICACPFERDRRLARYRFEQRTLRSVEVLGRSEANHHCPKHAGIARLERQHRDRWIAHYGSLTKDRITVEELIERFAIDRKARHRAFSRGCRPIDRKALKRTDDITRVAECRGELEFVVGNKT